MKTKFSIFLFLLFLLLAAVCVVALPEGPSTLTVDKASRRTVQGTSNISAMAGNVTQITLQGTVVTQTWQGYYGNITGTIALDSSDGFRMYKWDLANPQGEIYATEGTSVPQWGTPSVTGNISCWNYTRGLADTPGTNYPYYGEVEGWETSAQGSYPEIAWMKPKGIKENAVDSINNTFRRTSDRPFPSFYVGNQYINGTLNHDECPSVALYNGTNQINYGGGDQVAGQSIAGGNFQEVILIDNSKNYLLYTAIIDFERDMKGFDGNLWDFEMLVPENGHTADESTKTTEYNFYVELE